jgi:hypothetical protein
MRGASTTSLVTFGESCDLLTIGCMQPACLRLRGDHQPSGAPDSCTDAHILGGRRSHRVRDRAAKVVRPARPACPSASRAPS